MAARTVDEVVAWLKERTDPQDQGASNISSAIAIFKQALAEMDREAAGNLRQRNFS